MLSLKKIQKALTINFPPPQKQEQTNRLFIDEEEQQPIPAYFSDDSVFVYPRAHTAHVGVERRTKKPASQRRWMSVAELFPSGRNEPGNRWNGRRRVALSL